MTSVFPSYELHVIFYGPYISLLFKQLLSSGHLLVKRYAYNKLAPVDWLKKLQKEKGEENGRGVEKENNKNKGL